jgi:hypothetical protein
LNKNLRLPNPDPSKGPFQTAKEILKLRNMVAHPKPEAGERSVKLKEGQFPPRYQGELEREVSPDAAKRTRNHLKELAEELHSEARQAYSSTVHESNAFGPLLGSDITDA